jgi:hypothetical protein
MVRHARLRFFPVPITATALCLALAVALSLAIMGTLPGRASAAAYAPVAEYSFDEGEAAGTTFEDQAGENDGVIEGAERTVRGRYGDALSFDGTGQCATVPASPALELREELTVEAWIKPEGSGEAESIVFKEAEGEWFGYSLFLGLQASGKVEGLIANDPESEYAPTVYSPVIEPDVWTHVAMTYDGKHERLYIDGALVDTETSEGPNENNGPLRIGCTQEHETGFGGRIDEVRIYDRVLGQADIAADMEAPIETPRSGPVAEYSFDEVDTEGETETAEDLSGHGHTATLEGPTSAKGRYGASLKFDGEHNCVSIESDSELELTEEFALEAWVRPEGEGLHGIVTQEDESADEGEDPFAYTLLSGDEEYEGPRVWVRNPGGKRGYAGGPPIPQGAWSHLAVTDDGGHLRFYVDGELTDTEPAVPLTTGKGPLAIGCIALYGDHFKGRIDEVRVYDRALKGWEVAADMETPIQTPREAPVAEYSFDQVQTEGETQTVEDVSGGGHTATLHGATWTAHGRYGGALEFDAEDETYVSIPADAGLDGSEELTVEAWVRPSDSTFLGEIAMKEREGSGPGYSWTLDQHSTEPVGYFMQSEEGMVAGGEHSLPLHTWTHVAMTDDGAHDRLYVDGVLVDTAPAIPFDGHGPIKIGGNQLFGQWFDGRIDEVRVYERALNGAEVAADMESPLQTPKAGPVADYSFDEDKGESVEDQAGEHGGTVEGAEWTEHGRYGGAMRFDGEAMVTIPGAEDLDLTEEFTLEAWIRPEAGCTFGQIFVKEDAGEEHAAYVVSKHDSKLGAYLGVPGVEEESPNGSLGIGAWQHIAVTFDGSKATLYINGAEDGSAPVDEILSTSGALRIGGSHIGSHGGGFVGRIDEVRIYGRSLNASEVGADMEVPIQTPKDGPVAAYSFDEGEAAGAIIEDMAGENDGVLEGAERTSRGRYGDALDFSGNEGECASVPNSESLQLKEEFTIGAWVKSNWLVGEPIVYKETEGYWSYWFGIALGKEGRPEAWIADEEGGEWKVQGPSTLQPGVWTHLAVTYNGARLRLYVDGAEAASHSAPAAGLASQGPLWIGCAPPNHETFDGRIDELHIYDRALNAHEAADTTAPLFPDRGHLDIENPGEGSDPVVYFETAEDPDLSDGSAGSGLDYYRYRYSVSGGPLTSWQTTTRNYVELEGASVEDSVEFELAAVDNVANESPPLRQTLKVPQPPEESSEPFPRFGWSIEEEDEEAAPAVVASSVPPSVRKQLAAHLKFLACNAVSTRPKVIESHGIAHMRSDTYWQCQPAVEATVSRLDIYLRAKHGTNPVLAGLRDHFHEKDLFPGSVGQIFGPYPVSAVCRGTRQTEWLVEGLWQLGIRIRGSGEPLQVGVTALKEYNDTDPCE